MRFKILLGIALIVAGAVLSLFFWDSEYYWFRGGPLGLLLIVVGVFDVGEQLWRARGRKLHARSDGNPDVNGGGDGGSDTSQDRDQR